MRLYRTLTTAALVACFAAVVLSGAYLAYFYDPFNTSTTYHGSYTPLGEVAMSEAYASELRITFDEPHGLYARQLHHSSSWLFLLVLVLRLVAGKVFRRMAAVAALPAAGALAVVTGYALPDDLFSGTILAKVPLPLWYAAHLALALGLAAGLVAVWRRTSAEQPKLRYFALAGLVLVLLDVAQPFVPH
ncbi:hypothetical protein AB0O28_23635 [Microbispora sp. NPDC088329]|uniref:hypothetical protein n=1 Tax=Microbispora sp. NPDC088329 TaxID=3154869 RepID=UPI003444E38E